MPTRHTFQIIGSTIDQRTNTTVLYAQIEISDYLNLVGKNYDEFEIQRRRQNHQAYDRMKADILKGALLPTITLAVNPKVARTYKRLWDAGDHNELKNKLYSSDNIRVLDGLQRTFIIDDLKKQGNVFKKDQKLLLEIWIDEDIKHLIYRLIVLNAGQKPMSLRHQIELLFMTMKDRLESEIDGLEILNERDETRRSKAKKFPFDRIVTAYYCFTTESPEEKRQNVIVKQMDEVEIFNSNEKELSTSFSNYIQYLKHYVQLDEEVFRLYTSFSEPQIKSPQNWLAEDNVINSFFAAVAQFHDDKVLAKRVSKSLGLLLKTLKTSKPKSDPFALKTLSDIRSGVNPKNVNVGFETRRILTSGFKEFFREEGKISFTDAWKRAAK